ncbi:MAG: hypothetical protein ABL956_17090 [Hyphomonadaceae bacterium]
MKRAISVSAMALLIAACATAEPPPSLPFGLSAGDVATGFIMAVESCTSAAETGRTIGQLSSYRIIPDTTRGAARAPKPGYTAWAPSLGMGVVEIEEGPGACDVSAYGAVVDNTLNVVAAGLREKGYALQPAQPSPPKSFFHDLTTKTANGRTVKVILMGNEPSGAAGASPFSTLMAHVMVAAP